MRKPFETIGTRSRWRIVYDDVLEGANVDDVIGYDRLAAVLQLDARGDRQVIQCAVQRAAVELEQVRKHALDNIPNVGYRVVQPKEHMALARRHQRRSSRSLTKGRSKVVNVDVNGLPEELRPHFEAAAQAFAMQAEVMRRLWVGQKHLARKVSLVEKRTDRTDEEIASLKERLARLEHKDRPVVVAA